MQSKPFSATGIHGSDSRFPAYKSHSLNRAFFDVAIAALWTIFLGVPLFIAFLLLIYYELYLHGVRASFSLLLILGKVIPFHLVSLLLWSTIFGTAVFAIRKTFTQKRELVSAQEWIDVNQAQALTDELTEIWNRRGFEMLFQTGLEQARNLEQPYTLLLADVNSFKQYNDTYGHLAGDRALQKIAQTLASCVRAKDAVARYGGDEFVILCPGLGWIDTMTLVCRLHAACAERALLTLSIGAAIYPFDGDGRTVLIETADRRLYKAKIRQPVVERPYFPPTRSIFSR